MKNFFYLCLLILIALSYFNFQGSRDTDHTAPPSFASDSSRNDLRPEQAMEPSSGNRAIVEAFDNRTGDLQVTGQGVVVHILPDDTKGSRHQKFILSLDGRLTVLIAHNIDLAPRIGSLRQGDTVQFSGEYEWNEKGGVVHWTHRDPAGTHEDGWLRHNNQVYQ